MEAFTALAMLAMLVAGTAAGVRILGAAFRTRKDPELWIGLATLLASLGGAAEVGSLRIAEAGHAERAFALQALAYLFYLIGCSALSVGQWRLFRPDRVWAAALAFVIAMLYAGVYGAFLAGGRHVSIAVPATAHILLGGQLMRLAGFVWASIEPFRYHRRLRRQVRLGLGDPVVAHQFLLWSIASGSMVVMLVIIIAIHRLGGVSPLDTSAGTLALTACGAVGGSTIYTAFFPPAFYRRWLAARAAAAA